MSKTSMISGESAVPSAPGAVDELRRLLFETTATRKHAAYQMLAPDVAAIIGSPGVDLRPKFEAERLEYIMRRVNLNGRSVLDIGCNTGYFAFEALRLGAAQVTAYEGGRAHHDFVAAAARLLRVDDRLMLFDRYFDFRQSSQRYDVGFLLNVLHHCGDEFDPSATTMANAKSQMVVQMNMMREIVDTLVLQMGFNWKGDITQCLFQHGTKQEMIDFVREGTTGIWTIQSIGVAQGSKACASYADVDADNVKRDDALGEFLNRPIFILRAAP